MPRLSETLYHHVVLIHQQHLKNRAIARALHLSRNTVRSILKKHTQEREESHSALPEPPLPRPSKLDPFRPQIDELLKTYTDITAQRIYEELKAKGFEGRYTGVRELVRKLRPKSAPTPSLETPPRVPGELAECDWSEYPIRFTHAPVQKLQAFGYTLRYSTRKFYSFHTRNDLHALMAGHVKAFERFGGAARGCKYDNQKPVVLRWEGGQPIYNLRFVDFATYYEFNPIACPPRKPNHKPRVERSFYELLLSFLRGRSFRDLPDLEAQLTQWMDQICDTRPLKRMKHRTRMELFAEEQPRLRPLPLHGYDTARVLYRVCDIEGFIAYENNWYSLPYEYVTDLLPVRITEKELLVYRADLTCIARHALLPRSAQQRSIQEGHRPRHAERGPGLDQLRVTFAQLDEGASAFLAGLEKALPRSACYHARKVLALREGWNTEELVRALKHGQLYGAFEHGAIERILLARGAPRRLEEYIAQTSAQKLDPDSAAGPRDLAEYDALPTSLPRPLPGETPCPSESKEQEESPSTKSKSGASNTWNDSA